MASWLPHVPLLMVVATTLAVLLAGRAPRAAAGDASRAAIPLVGVTAALVSALLLWWRGPQTVGGLDVDPFASFLQVACCAFGLVALAMPAAAALTAGPPERRRQRDLLILVSLACLMVATTTADLVVASVGLIAAWSAGVVLTGLGRRREAATEAAFKALILGGFMAGLWLYGVSLVYGVTGETDVARVASRIAASSLEPNPLLLLALALVLAGLCFIVGAVPFHFWVADTCSGADGDDAGWVTTGLRVAGFAVLLRVLLTAFAPLRPEWLPLVSVLAGVTMVVGATAAVGQERVRRLAASAGLAQTGYLLIGAQAASPTGEAAVLFALVVWGCAHVGVFALLAAISRAGHRYDLVQDFTGFGYERPGAAALLTVCLLALAGVPPTAGFAARWLLLSAAIQDGFVSMAVLGALTSVVLSFACLRLVIRMYMVTAAPRRRRTTTPVGSVAGVAVLVTPLVIVGVWPAALLDVVLRSVAAIF